MEIVTLEAKPRTPKGTRVARTLRTAGELPAIVYGHKEPPEAITLAAHEAQVALLHGARMLQIKTGSKVRPCLIKEVQYDHLHRYPIHMDLARVDLTERVKVRVGIELKGVPKGVSEGGVLDQHMGEIEVECLVTDIPGTLHPLVGHLGLGESLLVKDLILPAGVKPLAEPEERVATVRELVEAPPPAPVVEGAEGPMEPERIGRVRKEEGATEE